MDQAELTKKATRRTVRFLIIIAAVVFVSAGTLSYWQGWLFVVVFSTCTLLIGAYFIKHDPALIERRMRAGARAEGVTLILGDWKGVGRAQERLDIIAQKQPAGDWQPADRFRQTVADPPGKASPMRQIDLRFKAVHPGFGKGDRKAHTRVQQYVVVCGIGTAAMVIVGVHAHAIE